jgi:hypothetical protein
LLGINGTDSPIPLSDKQSRIRLSNGEGYEKACFTGTDQGIITMKIATMLPV